MFKGVFATPRYGEHLGDIASSIYRFVWYADNPFLDDAGVDCLYDSGLDVSPWMQWTLDFMKAPPSNLVELDVERRGGDMPPGVWQ